MDDIKVLKQESNQAQLSRSGRDKCIEGTLAAMTVINGLGFTA